MTYQPGDVVLLPFPFSDKTVSKRRPVLLLTEPDTVFDVICLAITSSAVDSRDRVTIRNSDFRDGELPKESWVRLSKIYTINRRYITDRFGTLTEQAFLSVRQALCDHLGCLSGEA